MYRLIIIGVLAATTIGGGLLWLNSYIDNQVNLELNRQRSVALENAIKKIDELKPLLEGIAKNQIKFAQEDKEKTDEVINEFNKVDGANDSSGIDGNFVR